MRTTQLLSTVDLHVAGLPVRVVTAGVAALPGTTMEQRRQHFIAHRDDLRTMLVCEPRGTGWMSGAILQPSTRPDADWGVLFIEVTGVLPMCGAGTIAVATALVDTGMVTVTEPVTTIRLDVPIGLIEVDVQVSAGKAESATIRNVPSYVQELDLPIDVPGTGTVRCDIAFGGNFYAFVDPGEVGIDLDTADAESLTTLGTRIMQAVTDQVSLDHPESGPTACEHVMFIDPRSTSRQVRQALINHPGWLDRSPGGTGTSASMAVLHERGTLAPHTDLSSESFIGTTFTGRIVETTRVGDHAAIVPTITGSAWITALSQIVVDPADPFPAGFTVS